ncbi:MAG: ribose-5-phosphate isomerase RpiA [Chitinophagaceae bacterium]|nr:ribose-5-phosphate isomerase RpiA [Chitinophagaceae bacterium]
MLSADEMKQKAGAHAATLVNNGMTVGLGTGSTANHFIAALAARVKEGLRVNAVPTSVKTKELATQLGISVIEFDDAETIDIAVDGADEISYQLNLIKGGGGAMLQEKMIAHTAKQFIVMGDETKMVVHLGKFPLPVEVVPYGWKQVQRKIEAIGCDKVVLRVRNEKTYITDHQHFILDCHFGEIREPDKLNSKLKSIPGVVETGLFIGLAKKAIICHPDGRIEELDE